MRSRDCSKPDDSHSLFISPHPNPLPSRKREFSGFKRYHQGESIYIFYHYGLEWEVIPCLFMLGLVAFIFSTARGVLLAKLMNLFCKEKINPLIGSAGVSAVPMSARVSQKMGQEADKHNYLLMHAMANVAGVIGTAVAAGMFLTLLK